MSAMSERRLRWGALLPDRRCWPRLLVAPSSYLLVVSLVATMAAKLQLVHGLEDLDFWFGRWLKACAADIAFFLGIAAVFAIGEHVHRRLAFVTVPLAVLVAAVALLNAAYLAISGEQLSWSVVTLGLERFGDVRSIIGASVPIRPHVVILGLCLIAAPPVAVILVLRRRGEPIDAAATGAQRARAAAICAVLATIVAAIVPTPREYGLSRLHGNAVLRTYWGLVTGEGTWRGERGQFAGYAPRELVEPSAIERLRAGDRPNVLLVILESTQRGATTLGDPAAPARTPELVALAARGLDVTSARTVVPHTTKSVWSMMCGRLPLMQHAVYENSAAIDVQCVAEVLDLAGWRTGFFQSAMGKFEDRPRLVRQLGFREFLAGEHISGKTLGYLASDDGTLVAPLRRWFAQAPDQPFFATVLTSATHHPYVLSDAILAHARAAGLPDQTDRERYDREVEAADRMLGEIVDALRERGILDRTIIMVVGDHGEGFGDKGTRQHGANFFEEGLHVPWVISGPGVPIGRHEPNASLVDLAPTLLDLLGVELAPAVQATTPARSLLRAPARDRVLPFTCFYDHSCRGFVRDHTKVVYVPETTQSFQFDLARDPDEQSPRPLTEELAATLGEVNELIARHRTQTWLQRRELMDRYPRWRCPARTPCSAIDPIRPP